MVVVDSHLAMALACVEDFYARMFRDWPSAVTKSTGQCVLSYSGDTRLTGANHLWPQTCDALDDDALQAAIDFFSPYDAAWSVIYTDTYMPYAADFLRSRGYTMRWNSPLMMLDHQPYPLSINPTAKVIRASTPRHIEDIAHVMSEAFASSSNVNRRVARTEHLHDPSTRHYIIYDEMEPAACATVAVCGDIAGIWNVGTRYRFRRMRYATTIMRAILSDLGALGVTLSTLMASTAGQPLYERLGYRAIGQTYYMGPPYNNRYL
jgi:ribosomal protein S18 acetylase RimI-like enzyme